MLTEGRHDESAGATSGRGFMERMRRERPYNGRRGIARGKGGRSDDGSLPPVYNCQR